MKNLALGERKKQKTQEKENIKKKRLKFILRRYFFIYLSLLHIFRFHSNLATMSFLLVIELTNLTLFIKYL